MSTPQTQISICSGIRLNSRYEHSIFFVNATDQQAYFSGKVVKTLAAYSFLRKSWPLKVAATMEEAKTWNYLFFRNTPSGKYYYYFINTIEYINDNTVELGLEIDLLQTYAFDYELLPCFVERQHVENDTLGEHTLDEGLELGDLKTNFMQDAISLQDLCILVLSSITLDGTSADTTYNAFSKVYGNVFSGLRIYAINIQYWEAWALQLDRLSEWGKLDGVVSMWMYPRNLVNISGDWDDGTTIVHDVTGINEITFNMLDYTQDLDGYTPVNNKLYTYPFNFLYVTNNNGGSAVYRYERFRGDSLKFKFVGALAPDAGVKAVPVGYNLTNNSQQTLEPSYHEGLNLGSFPSCAWDADVYKIWLAQNQNAHDLATTQGMLKIAGGAVAAIGSVATGNLGGVGTGISMAISGADQIASIMAAKADMEIQPPQARGSLSANVNLANGKGLFTFYWKSVSAEYAKIIDDYFTMYGYKINKVKTPMIYARPAFTYVKTIGCHIRANLCNEDATNIERIYDKGITFWVNGDNICDYSQNNKW